MYACQKHADLRSLPRHDKADKGYEIPQILHLGQIAALPSMFGDPTRKSKV
jgi:hypothetical protein